MPSHAPPGAHGLRLSSNQCALRRIARARCPRPKGPVAGRGRSQALARGFYGAGFQHALAVATDPWGEGILPSHAPPGAHGLRLFSNQCALRRIARARCPRPQGPVAGRGRSQALARGFYGAGFQHALAVATDPWGEGILPSHAPSGAHGLRLFSNQCALRRMRGQDALVPRARGWPWPLAGPGTRFLRCRLPARPCSGDGPLGARCPRPQGPSLAVAARRPWHAVSTVQASSTPLQWRRTLGARASCPRTRRQARMALGCLRTNAPCGACEAKMPSPPGPVAARGPRAHRFSSARAHVELHARSRRNLASLRATSSAFLPLRLRMRALAPISSSASAAATQPS